MSKTHPTIPEGDLGFDAISYAREIVSTPSHHDADEFSACARETLSAMLAAWDRLRERHDTLFRNHAFLMATKIPPTVVSMPAPPADAAPSLDALALQADEFARVTFPMRSAESISEHLRREAVELAAAPTDAEEMADVFLLLGNLVHFTGTDLNAAVVAKLAKNRARKWGKPDAHGVVEHVRDAPPADAAREAVRLRAEDVEWVVNSIAELGVKIGDQFFFLYKGESLVYTEDEDDEPPLMWRHVGKREFGECCHPINYADPTKYGTVDVNDGRKWRPLLSTPAPAPSAKEAAP